MTQKDKKWVGAWSTAVIRAGICLKGVWLNNGLLFSTARTVIRPTLDGDCIRLVFSNKHGKSPLKLSRVSVGTVRNDCRMNIKKDSVTPVTFSGLNAVTIPAGGEAVSDEVHFAARAHEKIAVSIYVHRAVMRTKGLYGSDTWLAPGNQTRRSRFLPLWHLILHSRTTTFYTNPFLSRLDVLADADSRAVVVAGDSIVVNEIPYLLSKRLIECGDKKTAVLQQALQGNRLLKDGSGAVANLFGENLLRRFERDVLSCPGIDTAIIKIGFNDIAHPRTNSLRGTLPLTTAQDIINGFRKLIEEAHAAGIKIILVGMTPFKGFERKLFVSKDLEWSEEMQSINDEVEQWLKTNTEADGYYGLGFIAGENDPLKIRDDYTRDYAHFNVAGQQAFADNFPLELLSFEQDAYTKTAAE